MNESNISRVEAALAVTESQLGKDALEVSYKFDDLAVAYKEAGRLLDAANATAKAKKIRASHFSKESKRQEEQLGEVSTQRNLSAVGLLKILYRFALVTSAVGLFIAVFLPSHSLTASVGREILGSLSAATLMQLLLFPIKDLPRWLKYIIVTIISGVIWAILGGFKG